MNTLQIPLGVRLIDAEVASRLDSRQREARDRAPHGKLLTDQYQERLPTVTPTRYRPSPGMRHHSQK